MKKWFVFLFLLCWAAVGQAHLFVVNDVSVSAQGDSGVKAKEAALAQGTQQAFNLLLEKITLVPTGTELPMLAPEDIAVFVRDVVVNNEQTTPTKYAGSLNFNFDEKAVRSFLDAQQIPYFTQEPPTYVMVPVWREQGVERVLTADNPLYEAAGQVKGDLHTFVLPEMPVANPNDVVEMVPSVDLDSLKKQYKKTVVLQVVVDKLGGLYRLRTYEYPQGAVLGESVDFTVSAQTNDNVLVAAKLLKKMNAQMAQNWRVLQLNNYGLEKELSIRVVVDNLTQWQMIQKQLKQVSAIEKTEVIGLKGKTIELSVQTNQPMSVMMQQLDQIGMMLVPVFGNGWELMPKPVLPDLEESSSSVKLNNMRYVL